VIARVRDEHRDDGTRPREDLTGIETAVEGPGKVGEFGRVSGQAGADPGLVHRDRETGNGARTIQAALDREGREVVVGCRYRLPAPGART
jgi:hypothetical protein